MKSEGGGGTMARVDVQLLDLHDHILENLALGLIWMCLVIVMVKSQTPQSTASVSSFRYL